MSTHGLRRLLPTSERARLTTLYGGLLILVCGATVALVYALVQHSLAPSIGEALTRDPFGAGGVTVLPSYALESFPGQSVTYSNAVTETITDTASQAALGRLLTTSVIVFAVFAALSVALAWWMAGRVLRPVAVITATARRLSGASLHERINLNSPPGDLKQLADTFDDMLARIEQLVAAQQRFTANAAHELRTPMAVQRAAAEVGLADPSPRNVERIRRKLLDHADHADHGERLIEGLLLLSVTDQGLRHDEPVRLDAVAGSVVHALAKEAGERRVDLVATSQPLALSGDVVLLEHLVRNLLANAVRHNHPGGRVEITVGPDGLEICNTGPLVPPETVPQLFEPFRRLHARRHGPGEGAGLGLSIVASIARAHAARATATANPDGGLTVRVAFDHPHRRTRHRPPVGGFSSRFSSSSAGWYPAS